MVRVKKLLFEDNEDWVGLKMWAYLKKNPTFLLTCLYLSVSGLGLLYEYILFREFDINILDYSEAADFFLAAFKRPDAFVASMAIVLTLVFYRVVANFARKQPNLYIRFLLLVMAFVGLFRREILVPLGAVYFLFFYVAAAKWEAQSLVFGSQAVATITTRFGTPKKSGLVLIGATERFVFGVQQSDQVNGPHERGTEVKPMIVAIPFTNIINIEYQNATF